MLMPLNQPVAATIAEDRRRQARGRAEPAPGAARPPGRRVRGSAASVAVRMARRLDADAARRALAG